jgi:5,10-methylenetetrahydrofolate reductase
MGGAFDLICEVEPATRPDLMDVRHQVGVLAPAATRFLIPDNHIGRATVSSIAVAHEVELMGGRAIACVNARDRNVLGFRRDLLTASAYGVSEMLFVYGDRPETGRRSDDLTVRKMIDLARGFSAEEGWPLRIGVSCGLGDVQPWKHEADAWYVQVSYSADTLATWRQGIQFDGAIYAGVMVIPSARMARKLSGDVPQLAVPRHLVEMVDRDPHAGVDFAADLIDSIATTNQFDGVHLVPVARYREIVSALLDRR